ncbi:MAG: IS5 family transposase [Haliea sp.]|nr:IS5 family transposase [Haliea sp.]
MRPPFRQIPPPDGEAQSGRSPVPLGQSVPEGERAERCSRDFIVDASIISAPSSTKNKKKERDPEMHQTRKGNQWYFGMKAHIGVDSRTKLIHSVVATPANGPRLPGYCRTCCTGKRPGVGRFRLAGKRETITDCAPGAKDFTQPRAPLPGIDWMTSAQERNKSRVRAKVEHQFGIIKRQFGFSKVRYRGLDKNAHRLFVACALSNLVMAKKTLLRRSRLGLQASCA